jgi:zinc D-Ala-D-Ala dipeptidase
MRGRFFKKDLGRILSSLIGWLIVFLCFAETVTALPKGFVYLKDVAPEIVCDLRYLGANNFLGRPVDGYQKPRCILTRESAEALKRVQADLKRLKLGLKIFDAYRPQRGVNHFVRWAKDLSETKMKARFYPDTAKKDLFRKGFIASRSGHSRGSTVDLTVVAFNTLNQPVELDMGTEFDFFGPKSQLKTPDITPVQRANRMLLNRLMQKHGFKPYAREWWHFTLIAEPYPETYFDFPVK